MMKTVLAGIMTITAFLGAQTTTVIGVPSSMPEAIVAAVKASITGVLQNAKAGDRILLFEANPNIQIASIKVPSGTTARARMRKMASDLRDVQNFLKRATSSGAQADAEQIRLPQFLSTVAKGMRPGDGTTRVLLYGSPRYLDPRDRDSFRRGVVPNDAFITAGSDRSTYGTADRRGTLSGTVIHWAYVTDGFVNERERRAMARFWALYCSERGATLSSFEASTDVALERLLAGAGDRIEPNAKLDRTVSELIMVDYVTTPSAAERDPKPAEQPAPTSHSAPVPEPVKQDPEVSRVLKEAAKSIEPPRQGRLLALLWFDSTASSVDIDLYVKAHDKAEELYYGHKKTAEGLHRGDVTTSQVLGSGESWRTTAEIIEVKDSLLGGIEIWINLYNNPKGGRVEGLVRVVDAMGKASDIPFVLEGKGDHASGKEERAKHGAWRKIELPKEVSGVANK